MQQAHVNDDGEPEPVRKGTVYDLNRGQIMADTAPL